MSKTKISWATDVWNPVVGCTHAGSPGCDHCYARELHQMRHQAYRDGKKLPAQYSKPFNEIQCLQERLEQPRHWKKPRRVFVNSMSDLFHLRVPFGFIDKIFDVMWSTPHITYLILTKRPQRMVDYVKKRASAKAFGWTDLTRPMMAPGHVLSHQDMVMRDQCGYVGEKREWSCDHPGNDACGQEDSCGVCDCPIAYEITDRATLEKHGLASDYEFDDEGFTEDTGWMELHGRPRHAACRNVWLGFSAENQAAYEQRAREFRALRWILGPEAVLFASFEPLLSNLQLRIKYHAENDDTDRGWSILDRYEFSCGQDTRRVPHVNWVICGGESGPHARPMHPDWARSLRDQCQAAGVPFFFKQWGEWIPTWGGGDHLVYASDGHVVKEDHEHPDAWKHKLAEPMKRVGARRAGHLLDGCEHREYPKTND